MKKTTDHATSQGRFMAFTDMIASYHSVARDVYSPNTESQSGMMLTIMEMWVACDKYATNFCPLLLEYDTGFPCGMLDFLTLPKREDLVRLVGVEEYLQKRKTEAHLTPAWFWDPENNVSENSFAVRYYGDHQEFEDLFANIKRLSQEAKAVKKSEFRTKKEQYEQHIRNYDRAPPCRHRSSFSFDCSRCDAKHKASSIYISVFQEPLPEEELLAKTLVFEHLIPEVIARWRDTTLSILMSLINQQSLIFPRLYFPSSHSIINKAQSQTKYTKMRYQLASKHSNSQSSHGYERLAESATEENVCSFHDYKYDLYDTESKMAISTLLKKMELQRVFSYPPKALPAPLRAYILETSHSLNNVMADLSKCPSSMSLDEFKVFGNLRAGVRLQWLNILSQLVTPILDFNKIETLFLVLQAANEAGPRAGDSPLRISHEILDDEGFGMALVAALEDAFNRVRENWGNSTSWFTFLSLAIRLLSATSKNRVRSDCLAFLVAVRHQSAIASEELRDKIGVTDSLKERDSFSMQALKMSLICHGTFDIGRSALAITLEDDQEAALLIRSSIFIAELSYIQPSYNSIASESDPIINLLFHRWRRLSYMAEEVLWIGIVNNPGGDTCLDIAIKKIWTGYVRSETPWYREEEGFQHILLSCFEAQDGSKTTEFQYNLLTGSFLVNGAPMSTLPSEYLNSTYEKLFGKRIIKVAPCSIGKMKFEAAKPHFKHDHVHFSMIDNELVVRAEQSGQVYELIPSNKLKGDLPPLLVSEYVHWWVEGENKVEFRPVVKPWEPLNGKKQYDGFILRLETEATGIIRLEKNGTAHVIDMQSRTASVLSGIFARIEHQFFIHFALTSNKQGHQVLDIELPRFGTSFSLSQGETVITSNQYRSYAVDQNQYCGALLGLRSKLIMCSESVGSRIILVPDEEVIFVKDRIGHAASWVMTHAKKPIRHALYHIDTVIGQLKDDGTLRNKLFLCYLHSITSYCLPDPLTGRTGTEEALRILQSGAVNSVDRLSDDEEDILNRIASLSPMRSRLATNWMHLCSLAQHDAFYLSVKSVIEHVRRYAIFYPQDRDKSMLFSRLAQNIDENRVIRARNRSAAFRRWQFGAEDFTTSYDKKYEGRYFAEGSDAAKRTYSQTQILADVSKYASRLTGIIRTTPALEAITVALGCATQSNAQLKSAGNDQGQYPKPEPSRQFVKGFATHWLEPPSVALRGSWTQALRWLRGSDLRTADSAERYEVIMFFAALSFAEKADPQIIQVLLAFITMPAVRKIEVPVSELKLKFIDGAVMDQTTLRKLVDKESKSKGGLKYKYEKGYDDERSKAVDSLVGKLRRQWPIRSPSAISLSESASYTGYMPLDEIMKKVQPLFLSCFSNMLYIAYLKKAIGKATTAKIETFHFTNNSVATRELVSWSSTESRCLFDLHEMFLQPPPNIVYLEPRSFDEFLITVGNHHDHIQPQMQQLLRVLKEDCQRDQHHQSKYIAELEESLNSLRNEQKGFSPLALPMVEFGTLKIELATYRDTCQQKVEEILKKVASSMMNSLITARQEHTFSPVRPKVTPVMLLQQLSRYRWSKLTTAWRQCVVQFALALEMLQRAHRLVRAAESKPAELFNELENIGHRRSGWDPMEYPESLLFEVENGILIRPVQENVAREMRQEPSTIIKSAVMQLNMGEGKSSVIIPIVAAALADGKRLVRLVVTKPQFKQMRQILRQKLGGLLNRRLYTMPVSRQLRFGNVEAKEAISLCLECLTNGGVLLLQLDHLLSLRLLGIDAIISGKNLMGNTVISGFRTFERVCRDIIDEADEIFNPHYELTYAMSLEQPLELGRGRWQIIQDILSIVAREVQILDSKEIPQNLETKDVMEFSFPRIIRDATSPILWDKVARGISQGLQGFSTFALQSRKSLAQSFIQYITKSHPSTMALTEMETSFISEANRPYVLLLRGLLGHGILSFALQKRWRVEYGLDPTREPRTRLAVPFSAKDLPSPRSEFSHPDVVILLTCLSYYNQGLTDDELFETFSHLQKADQGKFEYNLWIRYTRQIPSSLKHLSAIDLTDRRRCIDGVFTHLRNAKIVIDYYLSNIVFPREMREFPHKLSESSWSLTDCPITGFSGTNDSKDMLPLSIHYRNTQPHTNASVLNCILRPENSVHKIKIENQDTSLAKSILNFVSNAIPRIQVILDVGAQILDYSNLNLARIWLGLVKEEDAEAVITFNDDDELIVLARTGNPEPFFSSPFSMNTRSCLVLLDEAHTRGTDLRLPDYYRAAVTLGPKLPKHKLVQACMRMRKLGRGQSVVFLIPEEIDRKICTLRGPQKDNDLEVIDVLRWSISETWQEGKTLLGLYVTQGIRHQYHRATWEEAEASANFEMQKNLAEKFLEEEAQSLARRYGLTERGSTDINKIFDNHIGVIRSRKHELMKIKAKCNDFGLLTLGSMDLHEEQERELAPEVEERRKVERPVRREPRIPQLHRDLIEFVRSGKIRQGSDGFMPAFEALRFTSAADLLCPSHFPKDVFVTAEFAQSLSATPGSLRFVTDRYHRPVQWVMTSTVLRTKHGARINRMVILSPWEVNELLPFITQSDAVHLHMYATRPSLSFRSSEELTLFTIPALPPNWIAPPRQLRILNVFAGQLYLRSYVDYVWLCNFLGVAHQLVDADIPGVLVGPDGFLGKHARSECLFPTTPIPFLKVLFESICRDNQDIRKTDMGRLLAGDLLEEEDFKGRVNIYQLPEDLEMRRAKWVTRYQPLKMISSVHIPKTLNEIFESDYPAFPISEYHYDKPSVESPETVEQEDESKTVILHRIQTASIRDIIVNEQDGIHRATEDNDNPPPLTESSPDGTLVRHQKDTHDGSDKVCRRCGCSLCHKEPDIAFRKYDNLKSIHSVTRWTTQLKMLQKSATQCPSCKMLYQIACRLRSGFQDATAVELVYDGHGQRQMLFRLVQNDSRRSPPFEIYNILTEMQLHAPWRGIPLCPRPAAITKINATVDWIQSTLSICELHHKHCRPAGSIYLAPTRLLDLGEWKRMAPESALYLRLTVERDEKTVYAILNITQDKSRQFGLTQANKEDLQKEGIYFNSLPTTYRDAIRLLRRLGIRYLWTDAMCILQDDENDRCREDDRRSDIYQHSYLTFITTASTDSHANRGLISPAGGNKGFKVTSDAKLAYRQATRASGSDAEPLPPLSPVHVRRALNHDGPSAVTITPGSAGFWAYQDAVFSPRVVRFTDQELHWECNGLISCECGDVSQASTLRQRVREGLVQVRRGSRKGNGGLYRATVTDYGRWMVPEVTEVVKRTRGFAGIARQFADARRSRYLGGLWEDELHLDLQWVACEPSVLLPTLVVGEGTAERKVAVMPSWSWMATRRATYEVEPSAEPSKDNEAPVSSSFRLIAVECESVLGSDDFDLFPSGCLVLSGSLGEVQLELVARKCQGEEVQSPKLVWAAVAGERGSKTRVYLDYRLNNDASLTEIFPWRDTEGADIAKMENHGALANKTDIFQTVVVKGILKTFYAFKISEKAVLLLRRINHDAQIYQRIGLAFSLREIIWENNRIIQIK